MNIKGNLKYLLAGSIVFLLVYLFLAAVPLGPDFYFEPSWVRQITVADTAEVETPRDEAFPENAIPFHLGNTFGYFTPDGTIVLSRTSTERIIVSRHGWATYPHDAQQTTISFTDNAADVLIHEPGYVHLDKDRIYLFHPGGNRVSSLSEKAETLWTREHTAPITAFNSSPAGTVIGYADGNLTAVSPTGEILFTFWPGGSDHQIILGTAISGDGEFIACISGIDRQRFIVAQRMSNQYRILYHTYLEGNLRRQLYCNFDDRGKHVFFETASGLGIFDSNTLESRILQIPGTIVSTGEIPGNSVFTVLSKNGNEFTLSAIEKPDHIVGSAIFPGTDAFLVQQGTTLFLGIDSRITRIDIRGFE